MYCTIENQYLPSSTLASSLHYNSNIVVAFTKNHLHSVEARLHGRPLLATDKAELDFGC